MTDEPENLMLGYLRRLDAGIGAIREDLRDLKERASGVDAALVGVRRDLVGLHEIAGRQQVALDRMSARIERIERRLDLVDA